MDDNLTYQDLKDRIKELETALDECRFIEKALAAQEKSYRSLQENVPVGLFRFSEEGKLISSNPAAVKMFGYDIDDDLSAKHFFDFFYAQETGVATKKRIEESGSVSDYEVELKRKDGSSFWGSTSMILVRDQDYDAEFIDGFVQDITGRKLAEDRLSREKKFTEAIINSMPGMFYVHDENRRLIRWNKNHEKLTGYNSEETLNSAPSHWFEGEDKKKISEAVDRVYAGGVEQIEAEMTTKDGRRIPFLFGGKRFDLDDGRYLLGMGLDISELKKAQEELKHSERRFSDIINFLPDPTFAIDSEGCVVSWNRAIEEMSGVKASDMIGKGNYEYSIPFYGVRRPTLIDLALQWDDDVAEKYKYVKKKGDILISETVNPPFVPEPSLFWNSARVLYNTHGEIIGAIEVIRDLSDHMLAEETLRKSEQQYRSLFENTGTATFVAEEDMTISQVNAKCEELIGFSKDEIEGKMKTSDFVDAEDLAMIKDYHFGRRKTSDAYPSDYELKLVDKEGEKKDAIIQVGLLKGTQKSVASIIDITPLRQAEAELRGSEERYRSLVANIPGVVYRCNEDMHWTMHFLSDAIEDISGYPASDFIDNNLRSYASIIIPEDRDRVEQEVKKTIDNQQPFNIEYRIHDANGRIRWLNENGIGVFSEDGTVRYLDGVIFDITEHKQAQKALEESENRYRTLFDSANDAILILQEKSYIECNQKALEMFGATREQIIGQTPDKLSPPIQPDGRNSTEKALEKITKALNSEPDVFEWQHERFNGELLDTEISLNLIEIESEKYIQAILRDITERKKLYKDLQVKQNWIEQSVDLFFWVRQDSQVLYVNQAGCDALGYSREELNTMKVSDFDLAIPRDAWVGFTQKLKDHGPYRFETRLRKKSGQDFPVEITANILNVDDKPHYFAYVRDISNRIKAEEALRLSEEKYRSIFENAIEGIFRSTIDGQILIANPAMARIVKFDSAKELMNHVKDLSTDIYVVPERREAFLSILRRDGFVTGFETEFKCKDGSVATVVMNAHVVRDENGRIRYLEGTLKDITDQKIAEQAKREVEVQLQQAQKMEAIGTLAGGIAHDFNNILSAVIGFTEIALDHQLPPEAEARDSLENVLKAAFRAKNLVKQILTFSRQTEYDSMSISLEPILKEVVDMLRASLPANIEIRTNVAARDAQILGHPTQIHQVMMNLCTNAGYAMRKTGGILDVNLSTVDFSNDTQGRPADLKPGPYVMLEVKDTGPGMTPSVLEQVFNPFFTTKPKEEGTGLGLAVVHGIVTEHDGWITANSQPGIGTAFAVYFPGIIDPNENANDLLEPLPVGDERILIVDDEKDVADICKNMLAMLGYEVTSTTSSKTALSLFAEDPTGFDLIITDQTMPEMTGDQLAAKILSLRPKIPVVLCTGYSHLIDERSAKSMGIREFVLKPVIRRDLAMTVRRALDQTKE